jgi:hypothetical protein
MHTSYELLYSVVRIGTHSCMHRFSDFDLRETA